MKENAVKPSPLQMAIYDKLKSQHIGKENAISMNNLAEYFGITPRTLRYSLSEIRRNPCFELCIMSDNGGYWVASSREQYKQAAKRLYSQAFSLLRCARANERKANLHNQGKITDIDSEFADFFKSFAEEND